VVVICGQGIIISIEESGHGFAGKENGEQSSHNVRGFCSVEQ